ncbi:MAG: NADH-quinone oxidoreductase subunit J [Bdellovibrionaceae bacterium]|nr:NADH-quinone oxidoreductase subunit J [Pseudobdellovibrionaceae bacterium]MBX3033631.1 NADH-quinone oxidoreductase subunit J [Pseudobdellovibrionaceae bacterium]
MTADAFIFWFLSLITLGSALSVMLLANPVYSALSLVMTMVGISALFVTLGAYFIAGVQLIVYAGAVMVLFVMVLMLFDLRAELQAFSRGQISGALKLATVGALAGLIGGALLLSAGNVAEPSMAEAAKLPPDASKALGIVLFTRHIFGFEALGVLLLVIAIGTVALARAKGGTHAKH